MSSMSDDIVNLRQAGVSLVIDLDTHGMPRVLHWGADLGDLSDDDRATLRALAVTGRRGTASPAPSGPTLLPAQVDGWQGRPGVRGHRDRTWPHLRLAPSKIAAEGATVVIDATDEQAEVSVQSEITLTAQGVVRIRHTLTNDGGTPWEVGGIRAVLPVPDRTAELLDFTGRWSLEKVPQRTAFTHGIRSLESRRGRTGHSSTGLLASGTAGFGFNSGEVWAVHAAWSGNTVHDAERLPEGWSTLGSGELLDDGEVVLAPGESYQTPTAHFVYSSDGLDGVSDRLHTMLRARPQHPSSPRPLVLNIWEAVYFDHDLDKLKELADIAARVGVERYVVDDGWFLGRRDAKAGLGDWYVDPDVWPDGLHPLVDHVRSLGMEFGLWFEPEMANPQSKLAKEHPDWLLHDAARVPAEQRNQHVVDVANPEVYDYLLERISSLVDEYKIDYIKWDHNRDFLESIHGGHAGVHDQTVAVYRLLDELRERHPDLEIESCASGGGRVDLGILERTDRVWTSDSTDPIDRQAMQRWTSLLLPLEYVGAHVSSPRNHITGRVTDLDLRLATAMFGHAGIEWDVSTCTPEDLEALEAWATTYKRLRALLHSGRLVRLDDLDPACYAQGVVGDGHAVYSYVATATLTPERPPRLRLIGLDDRSYQVTVIQTLTSAQPLGVAPEWLADGGVTLPGHVLSTLGLTMPLLRPQQVFTVEAIAV